MGIVEDKVGIVTMMLKKGPKENEEEDVLLKTKGMMSLKFVITITKILVIMYWSAGVMGLIKLKRKPIKVSRRNKSPFIC